MSIYEDGRRCELIYGAFGEDIAFFADLSLRIGGSICDLACGGGRVTLPLASRFPDRTVYGVDDEPAQLSRAKEAAAHRGMDNLHWLEASMVDVVLPERCGVVICALHSLEHLTDEEQIDRFFENLRERLLQRQGRFVFAVHLPDPHYLARDTESLEQVGTYGEGDERFTLYERSSYDPSTQLLTLNWYYEPDGSEELESSTYTLRLFFPREIRRILTQHGFEIEECWGWYDRTPLTAESATQLLVARLSSGGTVCSHL